ncbi:MAG TPA: ferredoxin reductase family protein [Acidimicrobiia bacterium]|nr:ferredoxin reductase family protein [Acidimicrobiia bacterium]
MRTASPPDRRPSDASERIPVTSPIAHLPQPRREGLVAAVVAVGAVAVLGFWWGDTASGALHSTADRLTAAGRITGLLGTYLVLVEVLLMSRLPWLDRLIGMDRLATWHRRNGEYCIWLLGAHTLFTIWGYAGADHTGLLHETALTLALPDMVTATVAFFALVAVGVLSARAVRRRVGYQTWYTVHLVTYLAIVASFAHVLSDGNDFVDHPLNRALWIAMYAVVAVLVLVHRVGRPVRNAWRHRLVVDRVVPEAPGVVSIYVTGRNLDDLAARPGQFLTWRFLTRRGWWQAHPFSLSAAPNGRYLRITVKASGDHTAELQRLRPGVRVLAEGPFGAFTADRRTRRRVLLVAGGIGIAPLRPLFETLPARPGDLTLLYRTSRPEDAVFGEELEAIARERGARVLYRHGSRHRPPDPFSPAALRSLLPDLVDHDVFLCGPPGMIESARDGLRAAGVPARQIHAEAFEL